MVNAVLLFAGVILCLFRTRRELLLENLVPRQQLMVLQQKDRRPRLATFAFRQASRSTCRQSHP
jgi:hypothetical protein